MNEQLLARYSDLIASVSDVEYTRREGFELYRARLELVDRSNLRINEVWIDGQLTKYSYYWLGERNELIAGWDNAPHHPEVRTHPHHVHARQGVEETPISDLGAVLDFLSVHTHG